MKTYKEILEGVINIINTTKNNNISHDIYTYIYEQCPELIKNENEQHRKWILEYLYDGLRKSDEQFKDHFKSAIAWLERQGKQDKEYLYDVIVALWDLLDKIDTVSELYIDDTDTDNPFRKLMHTTQERHKFVKSDGYNLFIDDVKITNRKGLEEQSDCIIDCPQNHQDSNRPNGGIVLEDFNGGEGFYKLNLAYLNKKQVEEVEEMVREWNNEPSTSEEDIKDCIGMCLTDADEQRFKNYHTNLRDCLAWLEKQGETNETNMDEFAQDVLKDAAIKLITWIDYNTAEGNMRLSNMECKDIENAFVSGNWDKIYAYIKKKELIRIKKKEHYLEGVEDAEKKELKKEA